MVDDNATATIDHNEFNGQKQVHACVWYSGASMTATYNDCYNIDDGFFSWSQVQFDPATAGDNFTIQNNYIHDLTTATANGHIDGYQTEGAGNGLIDHNTFQMTSDANGNGTDSAIAIWDGNRSSHDITVTNNLIEGGGFAVYAEDYNPGDGSPGNPSAVGGYTTTNIHFTNNKLSTHLFSCVGSFGAWFYRGPAEGNSNFIWPPYYGGPTGDWSGSGSTRSGNTTLETGENLDNTNPHVSGGLCT